MSKPIQITKEQVETWILNQPNDRKINFQIDSMKEAESSCGCLMLEYAKDHSIPTDVVGYVSFYKNYGSPEKSAIAIDWKWKTWGIKHETFGSLKKAVIEQG